MAKIPKVKAGDPITEGLLNRIVDKIERFARMRSASPYLQLWDGPHGKLLDSDIPQPTMALLSGSTSPYSWTEVYEGPSGTWPAMPSGDSGTAYEVNGKSGLAGKVVPITWTSAGDWRFQWIGDIALCNVSPFCVRSFPTTAFVGDTLGTHTLTQVAVSNTSATWQSSIVNFSATTKGNNPGNVHDCIPGGSTLQIRYSFSLTCISGGADNGKLRGSLKQDFDLRCCDPFPYTVTYGKDVPPGGISPWNTVSGVTLFQCGDTVFDFNFPNDIIGACPAGTSTIAIPGGGGLLSVTF